MPVPRIARKLGLAVLVAQAVGCGELPADDLEIDGGIDAAIGSDMFVPNRSTIDRPDEVAGPQLHVMYAIPSDGADRQLDVNNAIARSVNAFNDWLGAQTGGPKLRLDLAGGELDVTFVVLPRTAAQYRAEGQLLRNVLELDVGHLLEDDKLYAMYYDGGNDFSCGGAAWPPALVGRLGAIYLTSQVPNAPACDTNVLGGPNAPQYFEFAMLHELVHTLGFVAQCAPTHTLAGHTSESPMDLMYGGSMPWRPSVLDVGRDDYYGHGRTDCADLARSALLEPMPANAVLPAGW